VIAAAVALGLMVPSAAVRQRPGSAGTLVAASTDAIDLISATTGDVLRSVPIPDSYQLALQASAPDSQMTLSPDGKTAYVTVNCGPARCNIEAAPPDILAIPIDGGRPTVVMADAMAPAISPDGKRLAYLEDSVPPGSSDQARTSETVAILKLTSGIQ
jgi:hypothetical protein